MSRHRVALILLAMAGVTWISVGGLIPSDTYLRSVLLELGSGLLLFAVLFSLERVITTRIDEVRRETVASLGAVVDRVEAVEEQTRSALADLSDLTTTLADQQSAEISEAFDRLEADVSFESVWDVLAVAESLQVVAARGIRVPIPHTYLRLRFKRAATEGDAGTGRVILLTIEDWAGAESATIPWLPDASVAETIRMVMEQLQRAGDYNPGFDAGVIFESFKESMRRGVEARTRWTGGPMDIGPIIEVIGPQWAVTTFGLECFDHTYPIERTRLWEDDWLPHMETKGWVDVDAFYDALMIGRAFFANDRRRG